MNILGKNKDISAGMESHSVTVDDPKDLSQVVDFVYVRCNIPGPDRRIPEYYEQFEGCKCENMESCSLDCPCVMRFGMSYDSQHQLVSVDPYHSSMKPVLECNRKCLCKSNCANRVVQRGIGYRLEVFRSKQKGFGLRSCENIAKNSFVCEYAGELLTEEIAKGRIKLLSKDDPNYILVVREHIVLGESRVTYIDPTFIGNVGRFINHSCAPNLYMVPVRINNNIPHVSLFALRDIPAGEELTYDYSGEIATDKSFIYEGIATTSSDENKMRKPCFCFADNCRGFLPFDHSLFSK